MGEEEVGGATMENMCVLIGGGFSVFSSTNIESTSASLKVRGFL